MPKEYFSVAGTTALSSLRPGARVHVIGVAGVAMAQLAVALAERGFQVSGSDKDFYEPMGSFLAASKVKLLRGYASSNVSAEVDLVVIGNAVSYGHPEVDEVERRALPYTLFPKVLFELAISGKHSIVVTGTHGKTTTTALAAHVLTELDQKPSFFIGGAVPGFPTSLVAGVGTYSVVEGDEYDSCFFAKVPKFSFYQPNTLIVTAIEYDHADIYPSLDAINEQFTKAVVSLPEGSHVVVCTETENVRNLLAVWRQRSVARFSTYGRTSDADYRVETSMINGLPIVRIVTGRGLSATLKLQIPGEHNALNASAVYLALTGCGLESSSVVTALGNFSGVRRRQEIRFDRGGLTLIDDFAHHPTAVRETLSAIRSRFSGRRIVAVFEPRSNTSRRRVFQQEYIDAFKGADRALLCDVTVRSIDPLDQLIDVRTLGAAITAAGVPTEVLPDAEAIYQQLMNSLEPNSVILIMSNGGFGGLVQKMVDGLSERT